MAVLRPCGRWAFAEFRDAYGMEADFAWKVAAEFDRMIAAQMQLDSAS